MKKYILAGLLMLPMAAFAADPVELEAYDSVVVYCDAADSTECPELPTVSQFSKKHGYQHPHRVEDLKEDCTVCHSMDGNDGLVATRDISCASVDEFVPPAGAIFDTSDAGVEFDTTGTKVGYLPKGTAIKCGSCHEEVDVYVDGRKREFDFEDWREDRLDQLGHGDDDNNPPAVDISDPEVFAELFAAGDLRADLNNDGVVDLSDFSVWRELYGEVEPPVDPDVPVFNCNQVHNSNQTCSDCHNDQRVCE